MRETYMDKVQEGVAQEFRSARSVWELNFYPAPRLVSVSFANSPGI